MGGGVGIDQQSSFSNLLFNRKPKSFIGFISHFSSSFSEAEDVFAPMLPQMVQFSSVWVKGWFGRNEVFKLMKLVTS